MLSRGVGSVVNNPTSDDCRGVFRLFSKKISFGCAGKGRFRVYNRLSRDGSDSVSHDRDKELKEEKAIECQNPLSVLPRRELPLEFQH